MFGKNFFATIICLSCIYIGVTFSADCWSTKACMHVTACDAKGGYSQQGLCSGASDIQCCSW